MDITRLALLAERVSHTPIKVLFIDTHHSLPKPELAIPEIKEWEPKPANPYYKKPEPWSREYKHMWKRRR